MRMNNVFKGFGHLCLTVNDVDVSLAFYHGLLGFDILMRREKDEEGHLQIRWGEQKIA